MAGKTDAHTTIIIKKRRKRAAAAHHGGAWKVAYADFVTAMMAFFLLMWLLNATTEDQRKGLADYFNPTIPISRISGGGSGALNGSSVFADDTFARDGAGASERFPDVAAEESHPKIDSLEALKEAIDSRKAEANAPGLAEHIQTRMTPDGLVIELLDGDREPLYNVGSSQPSPLLYELLSIVSPVLALATNDMAITGHTDALAYTGAGDYSNWELSTDRAHAARRLLIDNGLPAGQVVAVTGKADTQPISEDPYAAQNRRIAVTLLTPGRG